MTRATLFRDERRDVLVPRRRRGAAAGTRAVPVRAEHRVLADMAFNLGQARLGAFKKMIAAVNAGQFAKATDEMKASAWHAPPMVASFSRKCSSRARASTGKC